MAFVIGILANGLRVALIGVYALYNHGADLHGPNETLYVSFVFFFGMVVLILFNQLIKNFGKINSVTDSKVGTKAAVQAPLKPQTNPIHRGKSPALLALALFAFTFGLIHFSKPNPIPLRIPLDTLPIQIGGYTGNTIDQINKRLRPFAADEEIMRHYSDNAGNSFEVYIGYFESQSRKKKLIDYRRAWMHEEVAKVSVFLKHEKIVIKKKKIEAPNDTDIYFWYFINGRIITNQFVGKFYTFWDAFFKRKKNAGIIIIETNTPENKSLDFLRIIMPFIHSNLSAF
ncbi:hypothetical protein DSCA_12180 [Desulfosarcina alkanivorans]|uniref:Methanolan biosynthesis EpsI domain-containing protein n=2 Tax=Desulfosarcina alkanivorans TaxID=571177 RepID=A0A5K7YDY7_9BACT|nr:hypothetical protein DSCA_12180 [Desulfosarcina alkanivorans]